MYKSVLSFTLEIAMPMSWYVTNKGESHINLVTFPDKPVQSPLGLICDTKGPERLSATNNTFGFLPGFAP